VKVRRARDWREHTTTSEGAPETAAQSGAKRRREDKGCADRLEGTRGDELSLYLNHRRRPNRHRNRVYFGPGRVHKSVYFASCAVRDPAQRRRRRRSPPQILILSLLSAVSPAEAQPLRVIESRDMCMRDEKRQRLFVTPGLRSSTAHSRSGARRQRPFCGAIPQSPRMSTCTQSAEPSVRGGFAH